MVHLLMILPFLFARFHGMEVLWKKFELFNGSMPSLSLTLVDDRLMRQDPLLNGVDWIS
jgi:hypothetical protein